jgi:recombination associated protein RdgC
MFHNAAFSFFGTFAMWFKNCQLYQFTEQCTLTVESLLAELQSKAYQPCTTHEVKSMGWVAPTGQADAPLVHAANGFLLLCLKSEDKIIPASVIKEEVTERIAAIEAQSGRKVRKKEKDQLKDEVFQSLLPRAFSRSTQTLAYIDATNGLLVVDASSPRKAEALIEFLRKTLGSLKVKLPELQTIPTLLTDWISKNQYPAEFTIEDGCVLKDVEEGGVIRCQKQNLLTEEIQGLIKTGREITQLRLSWCDQISFVLKEDFSINSIKFLDGVRDQANEVLSETPEAKFDADFCIMTETLRYFFEQMLVVFGKGAAKSASEPVDLPDAHEAEA